MIFEEDEEEKAEKQREVYLAKQKITREWAGKDPHKRSRNNSKRAKQKRVAQTIYMEKIGVDAIAVYDVENADILLDEYEDTVEYVQTLANRNLMSFDNTDVINFPAPQSLASIKTNKLIRYYENLGFKGIKVKVHGGLKTGKGRGQNSKLLNEDPIGFKKDNNKLIQKHFNRKKQCQRN